MKLAHLVAPRQIVLSERRAPEPGAEEVRIAVHIVGICGTDMEFYSGRRENGYPFVLGHECSGTIDAIGTGVTTLSIGDRVTVRPNFGCGTCPRCDEGRDNICPNSRGLGVTIDGCFAEHIIAPARYVFMLPQGMGFEEGALIEPMAVACRAVRKAKVRDHHRILVLGGGAIGLFAVQWAVHEGAEVTVCDPIPDRLVLARQFGASETVLSVEDLKPPRGTNFDAVIETAGISQTVPTAVSRTRPGGRVVLTGIPMDPAKVETRWIVWRELKIVGSFIYEASDFSRAATGIKDRTVRALDVVTHRLPFERVADAFELISRRGGLKALITVRQEEE